MTFYQELQLSQAGSKQYISQFMKPKDKVLHFAVYLFKVLLNLAFSSIFVTVFSKIFGAENTIPGLVVMLTIMNLRSSNLGIKVSHSIGGIFIIYTILAFGPKLANMVPVGWAFCINLLCIFLIVLFGCHNVNNCNHFILVLSYLLLYGADVNGWAYGKRLICLLVGAILTSLVFFHQHHKEKYPSGMESIFKEFNISSERSRWQIKFALCVSSAMLFASLINVEKVAWIGIAAMSVCFPDRKMIGKRSRMRVMGNIFGTTLCLFFYLILPESLLPYFGMFGGFGQGFSATYGWQSMFNSFSAVAMAISTVGLQSAIIFRIFNNMFAALYAVVFDLIFDPLFVYIDKLGKYINKKLYKNIYAEKAKDLDSNNDTQQNVEQTSNLVDNNISHTDEVAVLTDEVAVDKVNCEDNVENKDNESG